MPRRPGAGARASFARIREMSRGRPLAALVAALALAAPPSALAQSAGDEQYQDPFAQQGQGGSGQQQTQGGGEAQPQAQTVTPSQSAPAPTPQAAQPTGTGALPRTGAATALLMTYGLVLLLTGTALRRAARRPD